MVELLLIIIILILLSKGNDERRSGGSVHCNPAKFKRPPIPRKPGYKGTLKCNPGDFKKPPMPIKSQTRNGNIIITKHKPKPPKKAFGMNVKNKVENCQEEEQNENKCR